MAISSRGEGQDAGQGHKRAAPQQQPTLAVGRPAEFLTPFSSSWESVRRRFPSRKAAQSAGGVDRFRGPIRPAYRTFCIPHADGIRRLRSAFCFARPQAAAGAERPFPGNVCVSDNDQEGGMPQEQVRNQFESSPRSSGGSGENLSDGSKAGCVAPPRTLRRCGTTPTSKASAIIARARER